LFAIAPESVTELVFRSPARRLYAYRWTKDGPFQLVVAARESAAVEQCAAGPGFARWLRAVASVPVVKEVENRLDPAAADWADIELRDATSLEPIQLRIRVPSANSEPVVVQFESRQFVVGVDAAAVRTIASGCAVLGANR
jgi:hypothetical protein